MSADRIAVVGIGADGWAGLPTPSRSVVASAQVLIGSSRQLDLVPSSVPAERVTWPSPLLPALPGLLDAYAGRTVCVLASGDPMVHGIGGTLARLVGPDRLDVRPYPSSVSLAAARLGWPLDQVAVHSLITAPASSILRSVNPGQRLLILSAGAATPGEVAALLTGHGFGETRMTVLAQLGGPSESVVSGIAADWSALADPLNVVALDCRGPGTPVVPGLADERYDSDGQLTKREVRAVTLAALGPVPGELLWDIGAGSGSIGIEWMRAHPACRAIAVESSPARVTRIRDNATALGVPGLRVVPGRAPASLAGLPTPAAVFIGGGLTTEGLIEACLDALPSGGRLVANAVTLESEAVVAAWHAKIGGDLTRIAVQRGAPVGGFTGWRPMMPVTIWSAVKP